MARSWHAQSELDTISAHELSKWFRSSGFVFIVRKNATQSDRRRRAEAPVFRCGG